jgi:hypothetical protein
MVVSSAWVARARGERRMKMAAITSKNILFMIFGFG